MDMHRSHPFFHSLSRLVRVGYVLYQNLHASLRYTRKEAKDLDPDGIINHQGTNNKFTRRLSLVGCLMEAVEKQIEALYVLAHGEDASLGVIWPQPCRECAGRRT
jgi:hypothetical protein